MFQVIVKQRHNLYLKLFVLVMGAFSTTQSYGDALSDFANSNKWLKALHYEEKSFGQQQSLVDDADFFFSGMEGKKDPQKELKATIRAFEENTAPWGKLRQNVRCSFPFRERLIRENLGITFKKEICTDFEEWKSRLNVKSITLVFSSHYPNNPASLFGHTFLRLNRKETPGEANDLLSYAANFAAITGENDHSIVYMMKGLLGGYLGQYSLSPYYQKVNEYNYAESRDLWEYDLKLTELEVEMIVEHLWELYGQSSFDYYFIDENCSYQILALLEAVRPELKLTKRFHFYAAPLDTLQTVVLSKDILKGWRYRPALRKKLLKEYDALNEKDKKDAQRILKEKGELSLASASTQLLDFLQTNLLFFKIKQKGELDKIQKTLQSKILIERSKRSEKTSEPVFETPRAVHEAHYTSRLKLNGLLKNKKTKGSISFSSFYHDLLSRETGFDPFSRVELLTFDISKNETNHDWQFDKFRAFALTALRPIEPLDYRSSWEASLDFLKLKEYSQSLLYGHGAYGVGLASFFRRDIFAVLADLEFLQGVESPYSNEAMIGVKSVYTGEIFKDFRFKVDFIKNWNVYKRNALVGSKISGSFELGYVFTRALEVRSLVLFEKTQMRTMDRQALLSFALMF